MPDVRYRWRPHDRHPLRPVADRQSPRRQHPHRAGQLAVRAAAGGRFLLRLDDTDAARSSEAAASGHPRRPRVARADARSPRCGSRSGSRCTRRRWRGWRRAGRAYRAYETPRAARPQAQGAGGRGLPPVYDRAALALTEADHADVRGARGVAPALALPARHRRADRLARPRPRRRATSIRPRFSDPVVRRADGTWLYMLPSVVDDIDIGVTDDRARRGPCHQFRHPAPDVRGARGRAAGARPSAAADRRRRGIVEAAGVGGRRGVARGRASSRRRCARSWRGSGRATRSSRPTTRR